MERTDMNDPTPITRAEAEAWLAVHGKVELATEIFRVLIESGEAEFGLTPDGELAVKPTDKGKALLDALATKLERDSVAKLWREEQR
jgi:hypothetical protein